MLPSRGTSRPRDAGSACAQPRAEHSTRSRHPPGASAQGGQGGGREHVRAGLPTAKLKAINPDLFLLAAAGARDPYYVQNGFHAAYDWSKDLGKWAWETAFDDLDRVGERLSAALRANETPMHRVARFLNNNDTGPRFITRYGPETTRVAAVLLHALPGIPIVYTGDEIGAEFEPYEDPPPPG